MDNKKIIAVVGATGIQGGGLARAILDDASGAFALRAITRNPSSEAAVALAERGAEVVQADLDDAKTLDAALDGAFGTFLVTNYWEHFSVEREQDQARNLADAAARTGVEHVIWSTLEDTRKWMSLDDDRMPTLKEKYKVPHLDGKGEVDPHFIELGIPTTFFHTCFYWENLIYSGLGPQRGEDGRLVFNLPMQDKKLPGIAAEDIGRCAYGIFRQGSEWIGRRLGVSGEHLTGAEMAAALADALGEEVLYNPVPFEVFRGLGFPGADDLGNMFQFKADFTEDYRGLRDVERARSLEPRLRTFREWLEENVSRIPIG